MASTIGIDVGNSSSKIGAARARGVDVLANEVSNRQTPSLVSFGQKSRALGEAAATMQTSNFKNTIGSLKRLVGRTLQDKDVQQYEKPFINAELVDVKGEVGVKVRFAGEEQEFSATQLMGMYLRKLRDTASKELGGSGVSDVVISVPSWFTDGQRRAMLDAADIAGLNPLRLMNDTTAAALGYGITKTDLPEAEDPRHVVFCDFGHSSYQVAVVAFSKGQLTILATAADRNFGGRDFDRALLNHFAEEFKGKYKVDVLSSPKAMFRLAAGCERLKKVLSANAVAPLNVESLMEDIDAASQLKREEFEALIAPLLERVAVPLKEALEQSGLTKEQIHSVEMVGGSSRVPALKERVSAFFDKPLSFTSNQDEAVARGCTLACAILSPVFRVREFHVHDSNMYPIKVTWDKVPDVDEETELVVFNPNNPIPSTKILTFYRKEPFAIEAYYANPEQLPGGTNPWIGRFQIKGVTPNAQGDHSIIKIKARLNLHGVLNVEGAYVVEEVEKEEEVPVAADPAAMQTEGGEAAAPPKMEKKIVKKMQRKGDLPVVAGLNTRDSSILVEFKEKEGQLYASDKLVLDTEDRKNALEEFIYDQRSKIDERYKAYIQDSEKEKYLAALNEQEEWLYSDEGEEAKKSDYVSRLDVLHKIGDPIMQRWKENEERPRAASALRDTIAMFMNAVEGGDAKYDHLTDDDKTKVVEKCATIEKWLSDNLIRVQEQPKNVNPKITIADINKNRDDVLYTCNPIINKPKPKAPAATSDNAKKDAPKTDVKEELKEANEDGPGEMDID